MMWGGAWSSAWQSAWSRLMGAATGTTARPGTGALTATGYAPTVTAIEDGAPVVVSPSAIEATGYAPTVTATASSTGGSGGGFFGQMAALLNRRFGRLARVTVPPPVVRMVGFAPTVRADASTRVRVEASTVDAIGYAPTVIRFDDEKDLQDILNLLNGANEPPQGRSQAVDEEQDLEDLLILAAALL